MNSQIQSLRLLLLLVGATLLVACTPPADNKPAAKRQRPPHLVEVAAVARDDVQYQTIRTGTLRAQRTVRIFNQEEGRLTRLTSYAGDRVEQGDLLAAMDDALLKAQLNKAVATRRQAQQEISRLRALERRNLATDEELSRAATALEVARAEEALLNTRLGYTRMLAPFTGVVTERLVEPGDVLPRYSHLLTLSDPASLVTDVPVSELLLPHLKLGDEVSVRIDATGDFRYAGTIQRLYPTVDPKTRTGTVEVLIDPVPAGALPGQLCRITLTLPALQRLLIPFAAVRRDTSGEYVYVLRGNGKVQRRDIRSELIFDDLAAVREGLDIGEKVVTKGFLGLEDGKAVKSVNRTASGSNKTSTKTVNDPRS